MNLEDRIAAFGKLGNYLVAIDEVEFSALVLASRNENSWFTRESIQLAFRSIINFLDPARLRQWLSTYPIGDAQPKTIALVMAGNIPLVGFHDLLSVLVTGHRVMVKLSSKDSVLLKFMIGKLTEIEPRFSPAITLADLIKGFDAVIATGSDNSARYFEYYFGKYPHVIRKNRTSCAVLSGFETREELTTLGSDVFTYFGLGCRNVSKMFVPEGYDFRPLLESWEKYAWVMDHHKYHNNYDYQKSILLVNNIPFFDNGFVLLQESEKLVSPISVLYYEFYHDRDSVVKKLKEQQEKIQCIVGNVEAANVSIGQSQFPRLSDFADRVDTVKFLLALS
jgi:hypothetical protein